MSLTYTTFISSLANFLVIPVTDPNFIAAIPNIIDDAEQRLYRELDLLSTIVGDSSGSLTPNFPEFVIPVPIGGNGPYLVVQDMLVAGKPSVPISKEAMSFLYPDGTNAGPTQFFAMLTQNLVTVGPWPDAAYGVKIIGTVRPAPLSVSVPQTLLSLYFPDLLLSAGLAMGAGYLKDFGAVTDDPQTGMSWEKKLTTQLTSAIKEEARKKFQDQGWGSLSTGPSATPPRT